MKNNNFFKTISISSIWIWLGLFALLPNLLVLVASFLQHNAQYLVKFPPTLNNYAQLLNFTYLKIFLFSLEVAAITTLICLIIGYPFAYIVARSKSNYKNILLLLIIIPFWTSSLIRTYAIMILLKAKGLLNTFLLWLGIIHQPLQLLYSDTAMLIGLIYNLLPFMILPLYANIEKLDERLFDAARDLGANNKTIFMKITLPLTLPGIISGIMLVFLPAMTLFYIPVILGGAKSMLLGNLIQNQILEVVNWPLGSASSVLLILLMAIMLIVYWRISKNNDKQEWV